jgi:glycosyltransferase involved in cell wall biosynthesis
LGETRTPDEILNSEEKETPSPKLTTHQTMLLSVLICTHNPRRDYLGQVLAALRTQTLPATDWELIVVDNASSTPVATQLDLRWHPRARVVVETTLGLTPARLRAIHEAASDLLVFVDDDNVLAPDFLAEAARLASVHPHLGAFGCSIRAVYEKKPEGEICEWVWLLTVGEIKQERWSNVSLACPETYSLPSGAGLVIRANVAREYAHLAETDPLRAKIGRKGTELIGSEDRDLAVTSLRLGFGTGKFPSLRLDHLMPAGRVEPAYLLRLAEATAYGETILAYLHNLPWKPRPTSRTRRWLDAWERLHMSPLSRTLRDAEIRGRARAVALLSTLPDNSRSPTAKS